MDYFFERNIKFLTFDCYGTLFDWKTSIKDALQKISKKINLEINNEILLKEFFELEFKLIKEEYKNYSLILKETLKKLLEKYNKDYYEELGEILIDHFSNSKPFNDIQALYLINIPKVIISNTERRLIKITLKEYSNIFYNIITAEDLKCYKPNPLVFKLSLKVLNAKSDEVLHVSSYINYDLKPAKEIGIKTCYLNRYNITSDKIYYDFEIKNLFELKEVLEKFFIK